MVGVESQPTPATPRLRLLHTHQVGCTSILTRRFGFRFESGSGTMTQLCCHTRGARRVRCVTVGTAASPRTTTYARTAVGAIGTPAMLRVCPRCSRRRCCLGRVTRRYTLPSSGSPNACTLDLGLILTVSLQRFMRDVTKYKRKARPLPSTRVISDNCHAHRRPIRVFMAKFRCQARDREHGLFRVILDLGLTLTVSFAFSGAVPLRKRRMK